MADAEQTTGQADQTPAIEVLAVTRGEKIAGWVGLAVLAVLGLICFDLATGGRFISSRLPASASAGPVTGPDGEPCEGC